MFKKSGIAVMVCAFLFAMAGAAAADDVFSVKPKAGAIIIRGVDLDRVAPLAGVQADWAVGYKFGLRLGYEYAKVGVSDGSSLKLSRAPIMFTTYLRKRTPFKNFYMGFGGVATIAHYSDGHYPDVNKLGPAVFAGVKLCKHFNSELSFDSMKRYGRQYGGFTLVFTYDGF